MKIATKYLLVSILFVAFVTNVSSAVNKKDDTKVIKEKSFPTSAGKNLIVSASSGDVEITRWDKEEVYVKIWGNKNAEEKFRFDFEDNNEQIKIKAEKKDSWSWFSNLKLKFEIKVPASFNLNVNIAGGDIKIGGVKGYIVLVTSGGNIWGDRFEGDFTATTSGGDINLYCANSKINATTSGGDIDLDYTGLNKGIELSTSGGDISVKVPQNFDANINLTTSGGDVECNLPLNNVKKLSDTKIIGEINRGGESLSAHTSGGDIIVNAK